MVADIHKSLVWNQHKKTKRKSRSFDLLFSFWLPKLDSNQYIYLLNSIIKHCILSQRPFEVKYSRTPVGLGPPPSCSLLYSSSGSSPCHRQRSPPSQIKVRQWRLTYISCWSETSIRRQSKYTNLFNISGRWTRPLGPRVKKLPFRQFFATYTFTLLKDILSPPCSRPTIKINKKSMGFSWRWTRPPGHGGKKTIQVFFFFRLSRPFR